MRKAFAVRAAAVSVGLEAIRYAASFNKLGISREYPSEGERGLDIDVRRPETIVLGPVPRGSRRNQAPGH